MSPKTTRSWFEYLQDKVTHTVVEDPKDYARPKHLGAETDVLEYIYKFHNFDLSSAVANAIEQVFKAKSIYDEKSDMMVLQVSEIESLLESLLKMSKNRHWPTAIHFHFKFTRARSSTSKRL